jgi:allophanate hydrolase
LEILQPGAYASLQDAGRRGFRRIGVPWSGVLDPRLMRLANALAGNPPGAPVIECFDGGLQFVAHGGPVRVAVAGEADIEIGAAGSRRALSPWCSCTLAAGERLRIVRMKRGRIAVVAVAGLALPPVMGSAATYARAALGGLAGRALAVGDRLPAAAPEGAELCLPLPPGADDAPLRVVPGPQADHFSAAALACLTDNDYRVSDQADRMGIRLEGPPLEHRGAAEIISDATVPGSIQVPGNGQPIVLLADAQTAGGYPKIATLIGADLPRLAARRPGEAVRFAMVSAAQGLAIARALDAETVALVAAIRPLAAGLPDLAALYSVNLVSGAVRGADEDGS